MHRLAEDITDGLETGGNVTFDLIGCRERGQYEDLGYDGVCPGRSKSRRPKDPVTVRSLCLSIVLVLGFSDRGNSRIGSRPNVSIRKSSQWGNHVVVPKRKGGCRVSGIGIDHMRRHVISQRVDKDHMICHVTCLRASEDYTSRRNLESSKIQHVISKMFRDERRIVTKSTIAERFF